MYIMCIICIICIIYYLYIILYILYYIITQHYMCCLTKVNKLYFYYIELLNKV